MSIFASDVSPWMFHRHPALKTPSWSSHLPPHNLLTVLCFCLLAQVRNLGCYPHPSTYNQTWVLQFLPPKSCIPWIYPLPSFSPAITLGHTIHCIHYCEPLGRAPCFPTCVSNAHCIWHVFAARPCEALLWLSTILTTVTRHMRPFIIWSIYFLGHVVHIRCSSTPNSV